MSSFDSEISTEDNNTQIQKEKFDNIINNMTAILNQLISQNKNSLNYKKIIRNQKESVFSAKDPPQISILDYLNRIKYYSQIENNTLICSLIYIDKLCTLNEIVLTELNIHRILFTAILLSIKYNEDLIYKMDYYSKIAGVSLKELKKLESEFVSKINFELYINDNDFEKYREYLIKME